MTSSQRKTFTAAERELLTPRRMVRWLDRTHWKSARVASEISADREGQEYALGVNITGSRTRAIGEGIILYPGQIRAIALPVGDWLAITGRREFFTTTDEDIPADVRAEYDASPEGQEHARVRASYGRSSRRTRQLR